MDDTSHTPLFRALEDEDLRKIDTYIGTIELEAGDILFSEGDNSHFAAFVTSGQLEVIKKDFNNEDKVVSQFIEGHAIGEMALLDDLPRSATVQAKQSPP